MNNPLGVKLNNIQQFGLKIKNSAPAFGTKINHSVKKHHGYQDFLDHERKLNESLEKN